MASERGHASVAGPSAGGPRRDEAFRDFSPSSPLGRVAAVVARQPRPRPWLVLVVSVAIESACMLAIGVVEQTRHVLGLPGSLMALAAVVAGALGGPAVGLAAALAGGAVYATTVASLGARGAWPATIASVALWSATALVSAILANTLRGQTRRLAETSRYARSLIEASLDPLVTISAGGKITDVNEATERVTGVPREELVGTDFADYFTAPEEARAVYRQVFAQGLVLDYPLAIRHASGKLTDVLYNANLFRDEAGAVVGVFAAARDVTQRRRAEEQVARLAAIVESSEDAVIGKDLDGIIVSWNAGAQRLYGYTAAEVHGRPISMLSPTGSSGEVDESLERIRRGERIGHYDTVRVGKDGTEVSVSLAISPIKDASGSIVGAASVARDITKQKRTEEALRESESRFRTVADLTYNWEAWLGPDRRFIYISPACERITGYRPEEFEADPDLVETIVHPDDRAAFAEHRRLHHGESHTEAGEILFRIVRRDGEVRWVAHVCRPVFSEDRRFRGRRISNRDVTDERRADEALRAASHYARSLIEAEPRPARDHLSRGQDHRRQRGHRARDRRAS